MEVNYEPQFLTYKMAQLCHTVKIKGNVIKKYYHGASYVPG